jgi:hypothetical protein
LLLVISRRSTTKSSSLEGWPPANLHPSRLAAARLAPQDDGEQVRDRASAALTAVPVQAIGYFCRAFS